MGERDDGFSGTGSYDGFIATFFLEAPSLDAAVQDAAVRALVDDYRMIRVQGALEAMSDARDERSRAAASHSLDLCRDSFLAIQPEIAKARVRLEGKAMGKRRFRHSLAKLDELRFGCQTHLALIAGAQGRSVDGADLEPVEGSSDTRDVRLEALRETLDRLGGAKDTERNDILVDLYFMAKNWLDRADEESGELDLTMKVKVTQLFETVCKRLAADNEVPINHLPKWLEEHVGKGLGEHGFSLDVTHGLAVWLTSQQREVFKLHVKGGKLYQYDWWTWRDSERQSDGSFDLSSKTKVPVDVDNYTSPAIQKGYIGFVMSMGGDLYSMVQFAPRQSQTGLANYHSTYMAGQPILMAGELKVKAGRVLQANTGSGHYQPPLQMMPRFLRLLEARGIEVESVVTFPDKQAFTKAEFMTLHGDKSLPAEARKAQEGMLRKALHAHFLGTLFQKERTLLRDVQKERIQLGSSTRDFEKGSNPAFLYRRGVDRLTRLVEKLPEGAAALQQALATRSRHTGEEAEADADAPKDGYVSTIEALLASMNEECMEVLGVISDLEGVLRARAAKDVSVRTKILEALDTTRLAEAYRERVRGVVTGIG